MPENTLFSFRSPATPAAGRGEPAWLRSDQRVTIERDCRGRHLLDEKGPGWANLTLVGSAWSDRELLFHFDCWAGRHLPGRDTIVVVIQPESMGTSVKLEIDSQGRCVDSHVLQAGVDMDLKWESRARIEIGEADSGHGWTLCLALPLEVLLPLWSETAPAVGAVWRLNLARIIDLGDETEYLLWQPGFTAYPDVLDPSAFGNLFFLDT